MRPRVLSASLLVLALGSACASDRARPKPANGPTDVPAAEPTDAAASAPAQAGAAGKAFDREAAEAALVAAADAARACKQAGGPTGRGEVEVTFAPGGDVTSAIVEGPPFAGTPVGGCVRSEFAGLRIPPFDGSPVSIKKSFDID